MSIYLKKNHKGDTTLIYLHALGLGLGLGFGLGLGLCARTT